jgi:hypothetical protein
MARDGFAALERFGLELEAAFSNGFARPAAQGAADATGERASQPRGPRQSAEAEASRTTAREQRAGRPARQGERLAALEAELRRRLIEEGLVVRGHDIARVVAVSTGQHVHWSI